MAVHSSKPYIDGRTFDDAFGMDEGVKRELCYDGMLFVTSFRNARKDYSGMIIARTMEHAQQRAAERGFGETVDGRLEMFGESQ